MTRSPRAAESTASRSSLTTIGAGPAALAPPLEEQPATAKSEASAAAAQLNVRIAKPPRAGGSRSITDASACARKEVPRAFHSRHQGIDVSLVIVDIER